VPAIFSCKDKQSSRLSSTPSSLIVNKTKRIQLKSTVLLPKVLQHLGFLFEYNGNALAAVLTHVA